MLSQNVKKKEVKMENLSMQFLAHQIYGDSRLKRSQAAAPPEFFESR